VNHNRIEMSPERRIQSSRATGAQSRGPAQNSRRHGVLARAIVLERGETLPLDDLL
jgi:hypothetical protein